MIKHNPFYISLKSSCLSFYKEIANMTILKGHLNGVGISKVFDFFVIFRFFDFFL